MSEPRCAGKKHNYTEYAHNVCTCVLGKAAKNAYMKRRRTRANAKAQPGRIVPGIKHGRFGFEERGCRCPVCTAAHAASDVRRK